MRASAFQNNVRNQQGYLTSFCHITLRTLTGVVWFDFGTLINCFLITGHVKQLVPATGKLLRNATFMWNSLALTVSILYIQGSSAFIAKIINLKFAVDYQTIGIVLGSIFTPTGIGKRIKYILLYDMI